MLSAREKAAAVRLWFPGSSASASGQEQAMLSAREKAAADPLWFREPSASAPARERQMVSAKASAMADRRRAACHLAASLWAASDREPEKDSYSESESLLGRPMAEARARARLQRRLQQCRYLQYRRWRAMPWMRRQAASEMQGPELEGRKFGTVHLDW
jgi:hypothetical protein